MGWRIYQPILFLTYGKSQTYITKVDKSINLFIIRNIIMAIVTAFMAGVGAMVFIGAAYYAAVAYNNRANKPQAVRNK